MLDERIFFLYRLIKMKDDTIKMYQNIFNLIHYMETGDISVTIEDELICN